MGDFSVNLVALGHALQEMRKQRGLRLVDVAHIAGIPRLKVIHVEAGRPGVAASSYARVAAALGAQLQVAASQRPTLDEIGALLKDIDE
ncbi:helix-turn-helix domain-containing protein [Rhizobacter sp. P5_C2]